MKKNTVLGKISQAVFLREYWQKKPLLIRNAFPHFENLLSKDDLISLSTRDDAQSRCVSFQKQKWQLADGPFQKKDFNKIKGNWTLLVQGVNHFLDEAQALMQHFNFIPHARLDDLMVSFATDGSGVGPHFDSYDVFLLQGMGTRLWQISKQKDKTLEPNAPLRILKNFQPDQEWLLAPGDMLYLPPNYAHNGVAVGECMTYSIGFRAPSYQELANEFLGYLQENITLPGMYSDPDLRLSKHPANISDSMVNKVSKELNKIRFSHDHVARFLGLYLSEPKPHIFFDAPEKPLTKIQFLKLAKTKGITLDLRSQFLFNKKDLFFNGECISLSLLPRDDIKKLADQREISVSDKIAQSAGEFFYEWYLSGFIHIKM